MNNLTDEKTDEKLRKLAANSKLQPPEGYEDEIDHLLNHLEEDKRKAHFAWRQAAAIFIVFLLLGSAGVYGTLSKRNESLDNLTDTEKQQYLDDVNEADTERDSYSRELSKTEEERLEKLKFAYNMEGRNPKNSLSVVNNGNKVIKDKICFVTSESKFYFPEREMTDEELLELIDFYYKRDYSIRELEEKDTQARTTIPKDDIAHLAEKHVESIYHIDLSGSKFTLETIEESEMTIYLVGITTEDATRYEVSFQSDSDQFDSVTKVDSGNYADNISVDEELYKEKLINAKNILKNFVDLQKIDRSFISYVHENDEVLKNGIVTYVFEMKDQSAYFLSYSCAKDEIYHIDYVQNVRFYYEALEENQKVEESLGFWREKIDIDPVVFLSE